MNKPSTTIKIERNKIYIIISNQKVEVKSWDEAVLKRNKLIEKKQTK
jgi:hypothetical protein